MLIKRIILNNFRQFKGNQSLEFSDDLEKNVTILLGDNTFGKTTILQAFNWCLYGKVDFPKDSNPEFILNFEVAQEQAGVLQKAEVYVELSIEHRNMEYTILRKQIYEDKGNNEWKPFPSFLSVSYKENPLTKQVREGEEEQVINSILPRSLSGYFFFDTERVSDISSRKDLTEAVQGLLGLAAVKNARKHLGSRTAKSSVIGRWATSLDLKGDEQAREAKETIEQEAEKLESLKDNRKRLEEEISRLYNQKDKISSDLKDNKNTAKLQQEKQNTELLLNNENEELKDSNKRFLENFNNSSITYFMLPLMKRAENFLENANVSDKGIRDMTESSIRDIIKRGSCICGAGIEVHENGISGNDVYMNILKELEYLPPKHIGTAVESYKQLISTDRRSISQFYSTIEEQYKKIQKHRDTIASLEDRILRIEERIFGKKDMSSVEKDMNNIKESIKRISDKKTRCDQDIGACETSIISAKKTYDTFISSSERNERLFTYIAYAEEICEWIDKNYEEKEIATRNKLQKRINDVFSKMYHGERRVQIDKQYNVTLFSRINDKEIITGESEGLKRVKNFAFIAGLVDIAKEKASIGSGEKDEISWINEAYPLVMDAPFSNADETHVKNISAVLPGIANQVIMFVMEKDWRYAKSELIDRVGKYCTLKKISESHTEIMDRGE